MFRRNKKNSSPKRTQTTSPKRTQTTSPQRTQTTSPQRTQTSSPKRTQTSSPKRTHRQRHTSSYVECICNEINKQTHFFCSLTPTGK